MKIETVAGPEQICVHRGDTSPSQRRRLAGMGVIASDRIHVKRAT
jgi:Fe2+ transport system protein FeoA